MFKVSLKKNIKKIGITRKSYIICILIIGMIIMLGRLGYIYQYQNYNATDSKILQYFYDNQLINRTIYQ